MKISKKIISMLLCLVMVASTFCGLGLVLDDFVAEAAEDFEPNITLGGITQKRVVDNYKETYEKYQQKFVTGRQSNEPTNFVIPGLSEEDNYVPQGLTYWKAKDWFLISAYDKDGTDGSVIYALDGETAKFVALFRILKLDGSVNKSHGGGIAASEYNFYYADTADASDEGSNISYIPLSELDVPDGTVKNIQLKGTISLAGELGGANTSYCCYDDGVLWAGNFYYNSTDYPYDTPAFEDKDDDDNYKYPSILVGYKLFGNSSEEEWYYLSTNFNLIKLASTTKNLTVGDMTYTTSYADDGSHVDIVGSVSAAQTNDAQEIYKHGFATANLTEGVTYKLEFDTNTAEGNSDIYLFSPGGNHINVKFTTPTLLDNGYYHYELVFTAGLKVAGTDSSWPETQSTDGSFTGTYTLRFDQDFVSEAREFKMENIKLREYTPASGFTSNPRYEGVSCAGNPYYVVTFTGASGNVDKIQYAIVDKGKIYLSRSWGRKEGNSHIREVSVAEIDINVPGTLPHDVNGRPRNVTLVNYSDSLTVFGGSGSNADDDDSPAQKMMYMTEGIVVVDDYLYVFGESAAYYYRAKYSSNKCPEPVDVIWKFDHHEMMGEDRSYDDTTADYYQKVNSLSEINTADTYLIVHESPVKDSLTQKNIIYAVDAFGGYDDNRLPKQNDPAQQNTGDSMGIVGYAITDYTVDGDKLYITEEDDAYISMRWQILGAGSDTLRINSKELYYATNNHLYLGSRLFSMASDAMSADKLNCIHLEQYNNEAGNFRIFYQNGTNPAYYLWCNDGSNQEYIDTYTNFYQNSGKIGYVAAYDNVDEVAGTFHCDGDFLKGSTTNSGNLIGKSVGADMQIVNIYKRVSNPYSSSYESRVYSDLRAELQADGTYNIVLETYANSPVQYQTVSARPTDFIFVLDGSSSMYSADTSIGYHHDTTWSALQAKKFNDYTGKTDSNYNTEHTSKYYYRLPDGEYASISLAENKGSSGNYTKYGRDLWLWCTHPTTGRCYKLSTDGYLITNDCSTKLTDEMFLSNPSGYGYASASEILSEASSDKNKSGEIKGKWNTNSEARQETGVFDGMYYESPTGTNNTMSRLEAMQLAVNNLTYKIAEDAEKTGLQHRAAVVAFGSEDYTRTGMFTTASMDMKGYASLTDSDYASAFYTTDNFVRFRNCVNNLAVSYKDHPSADTFVNYGFEMANKIIANSDSTYDVEGDRSVCIVMITDGIPGIGGSTDDSVTSAITVGNAAIAGSYTSKKNGAYVYSIQIGANSLAGFNMDDYMNYVSSEFIYAKSMDEPGDRNIKDIAYRIDVPTGTAFNIDYIVNGVFDSITSNSTHAAAVLTAESVLREQLEDSFIIPDDAKTTIQTATCAYDQLGRLYFKDAVTASSEISPSVSYSSKEIKVSGFDYSSYYVAKSNEGVGKKLIVTISGVLANPDAALDNTSINISENTGIYENQDKLNKNIAVKQFPTEHFSIPEYNFIMDYDLPMYDSEVNGTLCSVDSVIQRQSTYSNNLSTEDIEIAFANSNQDLVYTLKQDEGKGYVLIKRDDGTYDWFRINIIPASNVYYEETRLTPVATDSAVNAWTSVGTGDIEYQDTSFDSDVYGYDSNYNNTSSYSNGTYMTATVDGTTLRTQTEKFTFCGKGFDLVSACGPETGMLLVAVRDSSGNIIGNPYLVDTYYNDAAYGNLTQVPVLHLEFDTAEERTVEITGVYLKSIYEPKDETETAALDADGTELEAGVPAEEIGMFAELGMPEFDDMDIEAVWMDEDSVLNTSAQAATTADGESTTVSRAGTKTLYLDGYRIYNPPTDDSMYIESEQGATYYNVANTIEEGKFIGDDNLFESMIAYVENKGDKTFGFGDYRSNGGPANEIYLEKDNGITFKLKYQSTSRAAITPSVMLGLRAVSGAPTAKVNDKASFSVQSKTEMYYDISTCLTGANENGEVYYYVTVKNSGDGILAVNTLKLTNAELDYTTTADLPMVTSLMMMSATPVEVSTLNTRGYANQHPDYVPEEPSTTNPDPDLDPVSRPSDTKIDMGNIGELIDSGSVTPASFLAALLEIFKKLFANIGKLLFSI